MKKFKNVLIVGSLTTAVAGAVLAPGVAWADYCCEGEWGPWAVGDPGEEAECDMAIGGGRVDGLIWVAGNDRDVLYGFSSSAAYSPAIRHLSHCNGDPHPSHGQWTDALISQFSCGTAGLEWSVCQTRLADGIHCNSSCALVTPP
jgi:hypothetical protein